jgi:hypothetical protein
VFCSRSVILSARRLALAPGLPFTSSTLRSLSSLSILGRLRELPIDRVLAGLPAACRPYPIVYSLGSSSGQEINSSLPLL